MAARLKKYLIFAKSGALTGIAYRGAILLWFLGSMINAVIMCLLWWAIYNFSPKGSIVGYTLPQMMMYMILSAVVGEVCFSSTCSEIGQDVRHGLIGMRLMKPINYRLQLGFTGMGAFCVRALFVGVPVVLAGSIVCAFGFGLDGLEWYNILLFIPAVILAAMFTDTIGFLFGQLAFRTQAMFGVNSMMNVITGFLSGALVPLALFPAWAQNVLAFTPFPLMMSMPVRLFLGMLGWEEIAVYFGISVAWLVGLNVLAELLYRGSVRHVVVFGG